MDRAHSLLHKETDSQGRAYTAGWRDALHEQMPRRNDEPPYYAGFAQASAHLKSGNSRVLWSIRPVTETEGVPA